MEILRQIAFGLLPSIGIGFLFYKIMKVLVESDRNERAAYRRWLQEQDARGGDADSAGTHGGHDSNAAPPNVK